MQRVVTCHACVGDHYPGELSFQPFEHPQDRGSARRPARRRTSLMAVTRRVKIVCTMGPATASAERIRGLVEAGTDVARLNFSHGSHEDHKKVFDLVREAASETGRAVAILADL